jgi:hypothetical protein
MLVDGEGGDGSVWNIDRDCSLV